MFLMLVSIWARCLGINVAPVGGLSAVPSPDISHT